MSIKDITNKNKQKYLTPIAMLSLLVLSIFLQSLTTLTKQASATDGLSISTNKGSILGNETIDITSEANLFEGKTISQISVGGNHSLALDSEGQIYAWGSNDYGQLGNGDTTDSNTPVKVDTSGVLAGKTISQISAGGIHSLALDSEGQIYAWGYNYYGQLGNGDTTDSNTPVKVDASGVLAGKTITQISAGFFHPLALDSEGQIYAWGYNYNGQLGNGDTTDSNTPVKVDTSGVLAGKTISQISAGGAHSLALDSEGQIYAWGSNIYGQLGNGDTTSSNTPVKVDTSGVLAGKTITQISAGSGHSLALDSEGQIYAWGGNYVGQLGNGDTTDSNTPVQTNFSNMLDRSITSIKFGDVEAISFNVIDGKTIKAITPPHTAGKVDITITDNEGKTWTILQGYEYMGEKQEEENNDNSQNNTDQNTISPEDITAPNTGRGI